MAFNIIKFLEGIFPFLFSAMKRAYDQLTPAQQQALTSAGMIGQFLKNNLTILGDDLVNVVATQTGLTAQEVSDTLLHLASTFGLTTTSVNDAVAFLQKKLSGAASSSEWNGILNIILNAGATYLSGGSLDWAHVAIGIGEWVYNTFIKPKTAVTLTAVPVIAPVDPNLPVT